MKSPRRTRRLEDESCVHRLATTTTILANTTTTSIDTSIVSPANHHRCCHCPSSCTSSSTSSASNHEDGDPSIIATPLTCHACERLHGYSELRSLSDRETFDRLVHTRENFLIPSNCLSFELPETGSSTTTTRTKSRCKMQERNSWNSRNASNVVRWRKFCNWRLTFSIAFFIALAFPTVTLAALQQKTSSGLYAKDGVCQSIDIRNNVTNFSQLKGCRVVEGFVQIALIHNANESDYANLSFPELVEITEYLLFYRVNGLRSIGRLFPNLAVIRGHSLFINYALIAYEMSELQELGLYSLTNVLRGAVRFEKNPSLCYVDTIDWDIIAKAGKGEHVISENKSKNNCPVCGKNCRTRLTKPEETLCWNIQHCQRICDPECSEGPCDEEGKCCDPSCLGGCTGNVCKVCKGVMVENNQCLDRCPNGTYEFMNRRCITEEQCRSALKPREALATVKDFPYKLFNGRCVIECPAGYMDEETNDRTSCKKCEGPCLKECAGASVDSIASAQKLRGCTHITGSLEIQIRGGKNIVNELEDSLNMIEVIDGYLKIVRSFPLISLNFLKNLREIRGKYLDNNKYTLAVLDNQNLQELWDWSIHPKIKILSADGPAKIFFHFNPKLCYHKIEMLKVKTGLEQFTDLEVAQNSNGDKVACNVTELKAYVTKTTADAALIEWEQFSHHDTRSLLGYVVYVIEAPYKNVTMYDGRDACGGDGWRVDDVSANEDPGANSSKKIPKNTTSYLTHILTQLKPFTQYAFYVKTYTIATERFGAQSNVTYFTTKPNAPSPPRTLSMWSNDSNKLVIEWSPPLRKNGNLTHYKIVGRWVPDDSNFIDQRNYCDEPMSLPEKKSMLVMAEEERKRAEDEREQAKISTETASCDCADRELDQSMREKEVSSAIAFEDALHNRVYVKRMENRMRRDVSDMFSNADGNSTNYSKEDSTTIKIVNDTFIMFEIVVPSTQLSYIMRKLRHYSYYSIEVQACRAAVMNDTNKTCSTKSMRTYRTLPLENADDIPANTFSVSISGENNSLTTVTLYWAEPPQPNGLVVTYQIEYKRVDIQNIKATVVCITRRDFAKAGNSYVLKDIPSGNYSVKVRATSLAGNGAYTEPKYFFIKEYNSLNLFWILFWSILSSLFAVLSFVGFYVVRRKFMRNVPNRRLIATVNPEYVSSMLYKADEWEVPREKIALIKQLGNGSFGLVYEGVARDIVKGQPEVKCAVKTVNDKATDRERIEFLNEASVMKAFNAYHVVKLFGVVSQGLPPLVVMELMLHGDLKTYLRHHRPDACENFSRQPPTLKRIIQMAIEIADGMAYLASKKYVHRDLAARNCMVAEDLTVKIGDFGMTRDIYETDYYRKGTRGLMPVRWMSPESLQDGVFTSFSDVWSYGVVLWEMVTLASQPYQGLSNDQVLRYVIDGGVMEHPENCPDSLYDLMRRTWCRKPSCRPTFIDIATMLLPDIDVEAFKRVSFYHSNDGIDARNQNISHSPQKEKDLEMTTLQGLCEEETEAEEDSPLRRDFGDFASFKPTNIKNSLSSRYTVESYGENSKTITNFHDMNSSKVPLKAGFDDLDGVSGDSITSSKDTINLPAREDSTKSVKNSPYVNSKSVSRGNVSKTSNTGSPNTLKSKNPDYENSNPERFASTERKGTTPSKLELLSVDPVDIDVDVDKKDGLSSPVEYVNKPETLNNGYIGGGTTT